MSKNWMFGWMTAGVLALAVAGFYAVAPTLAAAAPVMEMGRGPMATPVARPATPGLALPAASELSADEAAGLLYMYEEEKLARDVYTALYAQWEAGVFNTIAASEQAHMDAVQTLLVRYGVSVPANPAGIFSNSTLQALYTDLVARGSQAASAASLQAALQVGVEIEQVDIADLDQRLAQTDHADIQQVYTNLRRASTQHLRAFNGTTGRGARP